MIPETAKHSSDAEKVAADRLAMVRRFAANMTRSKQDAVGMSEVGQDCTAALWHRLHKSPITNPDTHVLAALRGTGTHDLLEQAFRETDPDGDRYLLEHEVEVEGMPGHVDVYDTFEGVVEDHKTKDGGGVYALRRYGPSRAYRWQLHLYGRGLELQGYEVKTVRIVAYAIDSSDDVAVWQEPYDRQIAQDALDHLARHTDLEDPPGPQKDAQDWCAKFCQYHDPSGVIGCTGLTGKAKDAPVIDDERVIAAAKEYEAAMEQEKAGKAGKYAARAAFDGHAGRAGDLLITWQGGKTTTDTVVDDDALREAYEALIGPLPMMVVENTSARYPRVRRAS
jgi:hypothetical protein